DRDAWSNPNVLFADFATPDSVMEALSLPTIRGRIRYISQHGSRKDRKRLKSLIGRVVTGSPGRPSQAVLTRTDVQLALEVQQAQIRLRAASELATESRRSLTRKRGPGFQSDPDQIAPQLQNLGYDAQEIDAILHTRTLNAAATRLTAGRHRMRPDTAA